MVVLQVLDDGPALGTSATPEDLLAWTTRHDNDVTTVLGASAGQSSLAALYDFPADPLHINIDARSMEILDAAIGFNTSADVSIKSWVSWAKTHPPRP